VRFEIWFPVATLVLGAMLAMALRGVEAQWRRSERRESQREQFQFEKLTELLELAARWHGVVDRYYWGCVTEYERSRRWPVGPNANRPSGDRANYNRSGPKCRRSRS